MSTIETKGDQAAASPTRNILVVGATGLQGRAFIEASLLDAASEDSKAGQMRILAMTRSAGSAAARTLASTYASQSERMTLVEADLDKPDSVRKVFQDAQGHGGLWGVFLVLAFPGLGADATGEEKQGKVR